MTDHTDLLRRLRGSANFLDKAGFTGFPLIAKDCREAADAIERESAAADMIAEERDAWEKRAKTEATLRLQCANDSQMHLDRALAAEADNAALRQDAERLDWLDLQADDWTYKESKVWKIVGPKISIREAIDSVRPMRQDDAAMREGKENK